MNYYRLRQGRTWMRIDESGAVLHVMTGAPGTKQIKSVKAGTLSSAHTERVFLRLRRIQFFQLEDAVPSDVVESDILKVVARLDSQRHEVSARPPSDVPAGLMSLVDRLDSLDHSFSPVSSDRILLRATSVSPDRAQELQDSGTPRLSSEELSEFEFVRAAVRYPDQFMLLTDEESAALRKKMAEAPYFLVATDSQNVAVDIYSLPARE